MQTPASSVKRFNRIQLIARVRMAYEDLRDAMQDYRRNSPRARAAVEAARQRLSLLNRALAMMALEVSQSPA
jgi:hypothetical protein